MLNPIIENQLIKSLFKAFKKFYAGDSDAFPSWNLIYQATNLSESKPSSFATMIYHVLDDLFTPIEERWIEYVNIDSENKMVTLKNLTYFHHKLGIDVSEEVLNLSSVSKEEWDSIWNKDIEVLNEKPIHSTKYRYENYIGTGDLLSYHFKIERVREQYRDKFFTCIDRDIPSTTFEKFIEIISNDDTDINVERKKRELTQRQIALIAYYNRVNITRSNSQSFLEKFGEFNPNSGKVFFRDLDSKFGIYDQNVRCNYKLFKRDLTKVLRFLNEAGKEEAQKDLRGQILK